MALPGNQFAGRLKEKGPVIAQPAPKVFDQYDPWDDIKKPTPQPNSPIDKSEQTAVGLKSVRAGTYGLTNEEYRYDADVPAFYFGTGSVAKAVTPAPLTNIVTRTSTTTFLSPFSKV